MSETTPLLPGNVANENSSIPNAELPKLRSVVNSFSESIPPESSAAFIFSLIYLSVSIFLFFVMSPLGVGSIALGFLLAAPIASIILVLFTDIMDKLSTHQKVVRNILGGNVAVAVLAIFIVVVSNFALDKQQDMKLMPVERLFYPIRSTFIEDVLVVDMHVEHISVYIVPDEFKLKKNLLVAAEREEKVVIDSENQYFLLADLYLTPGSVVDLSWSLEYQTLINSTTSTISPTLGIFRQPSSSACMFDRNPCKPIHTITDLSGTHSFMAPSLVGRGRQRPVNYKFVFYYKFSESLANDVSFTGSSSVQARFFTFDVTGLEECPNASSNESFASKHLKIVDSTNALICNFLPNRSIFRAHPQGLLFVSPVSERIFPEFTMQKFRFPFWEPFGEFIAGFILAFSPWIIILVVWTFPLLLTWVHLGGALGAVHFSDLKTNISKILAHPTLNTKSGADVGDDASSSSSNSSAGIQQPGKITESSGFRSNPELPAYNEVNQ